MAIRLLRTRNFRLLRKLELSAGPGLNLIIGANAAGKTSVLEAIYTAVRGRSFRSPKHAALAGPEGPRWQVFLKQEHAEAVANKVGMHWDHGGTKLRFNGSDQARVAQVLKAIPLQLLDPSAHRLLEDGPGYRRSFVDWGVFHVEQSFHQHWKTYQRCHRQRNQALKTSANIKLVQAWDEDMQQAALEITRMRRQHVAQIQAALRAITEQLLGIEDVQCHWRQGWPEGRTYAEYLAQNIEQHRRMGTTVQGPHRAELKVELEEKQTRGRLSRGQQKLLITAMVMAQAQVLSQRTGRQAILLMDDFGAELSAEYQQRLAKVLIDYRGQIFLTSFELPAALRSAPLTMFHVEQGELKAEPSR